MIHGKRHFQVMDVDNTLDLAEKLTQQTWTLCTGFRLKGYLFLNDAFSEDGAQEYAVYRESDMRQIESVTFSWASMTEGQRIIAGIVAGIYDDAELFRPKSKEGEQIVIETPQQHGRCWACA